MMHSKKDLSKHARNNQISYSVSQRRTTVEDSVVITAEIERIRSLLRDSKARLEQNALQ
jgi:hypothetical protein